jgi:hypothetical protein
LVIAPVVYLAVVYVVRVGLVEIGPLHPPGASVVDVAAN